METVTMAVVLVIVLVFAGLLFWSIANSRKQGEARARTAREVGLTPVQPDEALLAQISALYRTNRSDPRHSLHNVMQRRLPDGELFLFDLFDRDNESDSWIERQAVAIRSPSLRLPPFRMYPKLNLEKYALGGLANKIVEWAASQQGTPVRFPAFPAFEERYVVTSINPEAVQQFFDERIARYFANTQYYNLHAHGNLFTFAEMEPGFKVNDPSQMARRINRAVEIFRLFENKGLA